MDSQLLITFINYTNEIESVTIPINKNELILNSKYFESLLSEKFHEHNKNLITIDLTTNENCYNGKIIQHFFEINCLKHKLPKQSLTFISEFNSECSNPVVTESIININFCFDIDFSEIVEMLQLSDYFTFDKFKQYLIDSIIVFPIFFKNLLVNKQTNYTFYEKYILQFDKIQKINNSELSDAISLYKQKFVLEQFIKNIYVFFTFYKNIDSVDVFKNIVTIVDKIIDKSSFPKISYFKNIDKFEKLNITDEELKQIPLDILFQLLNYAPKIISTNKTVFKLYDFYDILNYESSNFETFGYICDENCKETFCLENCANYNETETICEEPDNDSEMEPECEELDDEMEPECEELDDEMEPECEESDNEMEPECEESDNNKEQVVCKKPYCDKGGEEDYKQKNTKLIENKNQTPITYNIKSIVSYEKFINLLHTKTNNIFVNFDWNNVILTGGFLYGLVDNICNSILPGSDIDLFVFGDHDEIENKTKQLLEYFSKFNPHYVCNGNVITLVITSLNYDIQIISFDSNINELNIITNFDYNYVKLYFNGTNIFCTLDNLLALKYKIAILTPNENQKEYMITSRIYKTITKGLKIKYDSHIKNPCINENNIKMDKLHDNQQIKTNLMKSVSIRKLIPYLEYNEIIELIKSYYKTQNVFTNIEQINNISKIIESGEYGFLKNKQININNINDIQVIKKCSNLSYYSFHTTNNEIYNNISIQTIFCNFKKLEYENNNRSICLILYIKDIETKQKLINLHNCLHKIIKKKLNDKEIGNMHICGYNNNSFKIIKSTDNDLKLTIHISKNMKNYDKIIEQIDNSNGNDLAQVLCSGSFWWTKQNRSCGIKFYADSVKIKKQYNIL